jgi:hypothetical protein
MIRQGWIFLGVAALGFVAGAMGIGHPGPCADLLGALEMLMVWVGVPVGAGLLLTAGGRAACRGLKRRRSATA